MQVHKPRRDLYSIKTLRYTDMRQLEHTMHSERRITHALKFGGNTYLLREIFHNNHGTINKTREEIEQHPDSD